MGGRIITIQNIITNFYKEQGNNPSFERALDQDYDWDYTAGDGSNWYAREYHCHNVGEFQYRNTWKYCGELKTINNTKVYFVVMYLYIIQIYLLIIMCMCLQLD